jgi:hypothetical protein
MEILYESDNFVVLNTPMVDENLESFLKQLAAGQCPADGYEIVDKRTRREVFLSGDWAAIFRTQMSSWRNVLPCQDEIEEVLDGYAVLAQHPILLH